MKKSPMHKRVCVACGIPFEACLPTKKYCSIECKNKSGRYGYKPYSGEPRTLPEKVECPVLAKVARAKRDADVFKPVPLYTRRCHDCGCETTDYRCAKCRKAHTEKYNAESGDWAEDYAIGA